MDTGRGRKREVKDDSRLVPEQRTDLADPNPDNTRCRGFEEGCRDGSAHEVCDLYQT